MAKSPGFENLFFSEEIFTDVGTIRRFFYQEIYEKKDMPEKGFRSVTDEEPMEVDTSTEYNETVLESSNEDNYACLKQRFNLNLKGNLLDTTSEFKVIRPSYATIFHIILIFIVLLSTFTVVFFIINNSYLRLNPEIQFRYIKNALKEKLLSQDEVLRTIGHNLDDLIKTQAPKLLVFVGTTGVGKTFVANIFKKFYLSEHVHEVLPQNLSNIACHKAIIAKLDAYCYNLILIDNLRATHLETLTSFILKLPTDYKLLIIPIFNVHDTINGVLYTINTDDYNLIRNKIDALQMDFELIVFRQLDEDIVKIWLKKKLNEKGVNSSKHDKLIEYMLRKNYVKKKGFKGLKAKLSLIDDL